MWIAPPGLLHNLQTRRSRGTHLVNLSSVCRVGSFYPAALSASTSLTGSSSSKITSLAFDDAGCICGQTPQWPQLEDTALPEPHRSLGPTIPLRIHPQNSPKRGQNGDHGPNLGFGCAFGHFCVWKPPNEGACTPETCPVTGALGRQAQDVVNSWFLARH